MTTSQNVALPSVVELRPTQTAKTWAARHSPS